MSKPPLQVGDEVFRIDRGDRIISGPHKVEAERKYKYRRNVKINGDWYSDDGFRAGEHYGWGRMEHDSTELRERIAERERQEEWDRLMQKLRGAMSRVRRDDLPTESVKALLVQFGVDPDESTPGLR